MVYSKLLTLDSFYLFSQCLKTMNVDRITRNWFKVGVSIFDEEDKQYRKRCSCYFDENIFLLTITCLRILPSQIYIYRNKYPPLHFIFIPPILRVLLRYRPKVILLCPPPPPVYENLQKYHPPAHSTPYYN